MTTTVADRVVLDTDVLLTATDSGRRDHARAVAALEKWPARGTVLYTSGQILREYLAVATRPVAVNGLGLSQRDALANVRALGERLKLLDETRKVHDRLLAILDDIPCTGPQFHDANVVATMSVHGVRTLVTYNIDDFARFADSIRTVVP
jgi:predicted nucleic acid-binding protein